MTKYKKYLQKMIEENKDNFDEFRILHEKYLTNKDLWQNEFNEKGEKILELVREYENRLCANQERGIYNKFSTSLAEKFQNEVRKLFPLIDHIGLVVEDTDFSDKSNFTIKKINLSQPI